MRKETLETGNPLRFKDKIIKADIQEIEKNWMFQSSIIIENKFSDRSNPLI